MTLDPRILTFDELPSAILVWEYDPPLVSTGDLRLVAANRAAEAIGPRWPMRDWIGRLRREMRPSIDALDPLYLDVAATGETRVVRGLRDDKGRIFDARVFALAPNRVAVSFDNVTEGRQIEEAHRAIFERTHDTILIIDPDTEVVLETNPAAKGVYGRDIVGLSMFELSKNHREGMSAKIINAGFVHFETTHLRADGGEIHLDVHARPIVREGRTVVAGISRDVTEQVDARRALQASEEKYRTIVENVPVILWTTDASGTAGFLSGGVERVTGFTLDEVNRSLWLSRIDPADHTRLMTAYGALFESGTPFEVEYRFLRKDGRWAWFLDQSGRTYERDGRRLADGVTQDITERKRGELQQLALAELGRRALGQTEAQALMNDACRTAASVLEVPMTSVLLHEPEENAFFVAATYGVEIAPDFRVPNLPDRLAAQTFAGDEAITYDNVREERRFDTADLVRLDTRAGMCVPISGRKRRFGVLHAHTNEPRLFTARETAFLQATANVLAEALHRSGAERELERRQVQLANAQELAHIGSLEVDVDTGRIEWSDEMYRIAGLEPQSREIDVEYVKRFVVAEIHALLSPDHPQLARGEIVEVDHEMYAAGGRRRIVHSRVRLVLDRLTGRRKIVATVQDITEKREADAALRDRERRLQLIVARLPVILFSTDAELRINSLTGAGFEPIGEGMTDALRFRLPDLISDPPGGPDEGALAALRGQSVSYETTHGTRELRVHIEPLLDDRGNGVGTVGIAFDMTAEKRVSRANRALLEQLHAAAEEWRETFDSIQAPIVITDDEACVFRMNAAALRLSRYDDYTDAVGEPLEALGTEAIWKELDALARASAGQGEATSLQGVDADGRSWDLLASRSARGQTIIIASDVTELVRMQDKLLRTERMSEMGALVAGVAHEVRNPLFGISATLDAFENHYDMEEFREYIAALREQVDRMSQLMHELLEYGRPFASVLHPECIALVVNGSVANAGSLARQHNVTLQSSVPPSLVAVPMDRPRMAQVFDNLIANAIQHSRQGGVVSISAEVDDGRWARITVEDRGPGFREDDLVRIFEPFFTRRRGGTGLGLSVVQRIVDEHGGTVVASNRAGGGATMIVTLPIAREDA